MFVLYCCRFLADAEWEAVEKQTELIDPYQTTEEEVGCRFLQYNRQKPEFTQLNIIQKKTSEI